MQKQFISKLKITYPLSKDMFTPKFSQICFSNQLHMRTTITILLFIITTLTGACSSSRQIANDDKIKRMKLLSVYVIPFNKEFQHTVVGGLSGIDYDKKKNIYYIISDDRSERNPARFYKAQIIINHNKIDSVVFIGTTFLKNKDNNLYPGVSVNPYNTPDPEALRYNPTNNTFIWSSEGERNIRTGKPVLADPSVTEINEEGNYIDTLILPAQMHMAKEEKGPRRNGVFEGLAFADNYKSLFVSVEEPLYNDGSRAGLNDSTGIIRILKYNLSTKKPTAQYAYLIDAVAHPPRPTGAYIINGVSDILSAGKNQLLVVERSFSTGRLSCTVKIYLADLSAAENIQGISSLKNNPVKKIAAKKLLLNMDDLGIYIDNIESVCFGPTLSNGHRTLVFVSDNNFEVFQRTQFLLFEIE